ncbi:GNAT family N-acetyltransferase [Pseudotenacibaculum sp. MALMAid0570]|uniref:GNAT family N-acetyltransferase n=1 Tax=Pseudotenacibaculum sp. MALMAid0570 TaxID=3143938 RepID=UPI0032DEAA32
MVLDIKSLREEKILDVIPLIRKINHKTPQDLLESRFKEMIKLPHYECIGMYLDNELIGISGLWYSTRHYIGKTVEPDHVVIDEKHRNKGLGKKFFQWIHEYTKSKGCEAIELNTYVENRKSHKFYYNEGYEIFGFHMLKVLRENQQFY